MRPVEPAAPAAPAAPPRPRHPVLIRLLVAPLVLAALVGLAWIHVATGSPRVTDLLLGLLGLGGGLELARLLGLGRGPAAVAAASCAALAAVGLLAPEPDATRHALRLGLVAGALLAQLALHATDLGPGAADRLARALVPTLYVGLLFGFTRELADGPAGGRQLLYVVLVAKASDIGGWLVGRPFGRHKLAPSISPGKSWEGLAGGVAASATAALLLAGALGAPQAAWGALHRVGFGVALALASLAAGLTQSAWKRRLAAKDSSRLIPEMGGVLDMIDSLLLAAPLAALWILSASGAGGGT